MNIDEPPKGATIPLQEGAPSGMFASYVPHDLKYSAEFEDGVMRAVLGLESAPASKSEGIRVIPDDSDEPAVAGVSVRSEAASLQNLPSIDEETLPLALDDTRRLYASPLPGIKLTHPGGYLHGGPGLDSEIDTFPEDFLANNPRVHTPGQLRGAIERDIAASREILHERMRTRQRAIQKNEQIEKELNLLMEEHSMELKINRKLADERRAKKEAKAKRKMEREAG